MCHKTVYDLLPNEYLPTIASLGTQMDRVFQDEIITGTLWRTARKTFQVVEE